jgi:hypothetical protein
MRTVRICLLLAAIVATSCSRWIAPPYTSVDKIIKVKAGMTIEQVNSALGIDPYDIYQIQEDGSSIYLYYYRTKDRRMTVPPFAGARERAIRGDEQAQTAGSTWYGEQNLLYVLFKANKLKSLVSDKGRKDGQYLLLTINGLQVITKDELNTFIRPSNTILYLDDKDKTIKSIDVNGPNPNLKSIIAPNGQQMAPGIDEKKGTLIDKNKSGTLRKVGIVAGVLAGTYLVVAIIALIATS